MKELPCLEEIYDFETEQLEQVLADLDRLLASSPTIDQLPKGFDNFEKFERKALKLREHLELELEERQQVDDVISFFVQQSNKIDYLNDEQFYQPAAKSGNQQIQNVGGQEGYQSQQMMQSSQIKSQTIQALPLNPSNLARLPTLQQQFDSNQQTPLNQTLLETQQEDHTTPYEGPISDVHSSVSKQINTRTQISGGNSIKSKKDLQAFMREKLAKTKISSESTSSIQPIAQGQKNFISAKSSNTHSEQIKPNVARVSTAGQEKSFYKPQLKSTKESSMYISGPSTNLNKPITKKKEPAVKKDNTKIMKEKPPLKAQQQEKIDKQEPNIYKPQMSAKPLSRSSTIKTDQKSISSTKQSIIEINPQSTKLQTQDDDSLGQWSEPPNISLQHEDFSDLPHSSMQIMQHNEEIESLYQEDTHTNIVQQQEIVLDTQDEEDGGEDDDEEVKEGQNEEDEDFYSELGQTAQVSTSQLRGIITSTDIIGCDITPPSILNQHPNIEPQITVRASTQMVEQQQKIRGKVQLIVDDVAVMHNSSLLTTPRDASARSTLTGVLVDPDTQEVFYPHQYTVAVVLDQEKPVQEISIQETKVEVVVVKQKPVSKTLELIKKITSQAQETDEESQKRKKEEQEERLKQIRDLIDQEKKQIAADTTTTIIAAITKQPDEKIITPLAISKPPKKVIAKKPIAKVEPETLLNGLPIVDYSGHYKSFYDIFVGGLLEPKTFDLHFVVRDTRNTYASFVSLMSTSSAVDKKYQFEQAPTEKSFQDYYKEQGMPNFFSLTGKALQLGMSGDQAPGGQQQDLMMQALAQQELKDRYQNLIKHKDINDILKDANTKITSSSEVTVYDKNRDSSLFYRVVKNRSEVYDIISRSFSRKKHWNELPHGLDLRNSWNLLWTWSKIKIDLSKLLVWQRCNHFSGAKNVSRKDFLKRNIEMAMKMSPKAAQVFNITPQTFILPKEYVNFLETFSELEDKEGKFNYWIMKPAAKSRGRGISLINDLTQVTYGEPIVVQKYIKNPLLINGYKFDMRIYVLVTSVNPLEAFLYKDGFGRFSTIPFSLDPNDKNNKYIHLTNVSIQKYNNGTTNDYLHSEDGASDILYGGTKISIPTLKKRVQLATGVSWDDQIWPQMREVIVKTLVACQNDMQFNPCAMELFGYDILVDEDMRCWLIEVNSSPSLARDTLLDDMVKSKLIDDIIDLVEPVDFDRKRLFEVLERRINEDFKGGNQPQPTGGNAKKLMNRDLSYILNSRLPRKYGEMPRNMGNFERIAPSAQCDQYLKMIGGQKMFGSLMKVSEPAIIVADPSKKGTKATKHQKAVITAVPMTVHDPESQLQQDDDV